MENNLVTGVEKIRHLTALWRKNTRCKPLLAICHLDTPQSFRGRERERSQSDRARERENWGQRKMGDSKEGRKEEKEEWEAKASGERSSKGK